MRRRELTACPVCHAPVKGQPADCPQCGTSLANYYQLYQRANELVQQSLDAVSRHDFTKASALVAELRRVNPQFEQDALVISAKAALYQHQFEEAARLVAELPSGNDHRSSLEIEMAELQRAEQDGKEHFNLALSSARKGHWADAEFHITRALTLIPYLPEPWQLAVKLALKRKDWELALERMEQSLIAVPEDLRLQKLAVEMRMQAR